MKKKLFTAINVKQVLEKALDKENPDRKENDDNPLANNPTFASRLTVS